MFDASAYPAPWPLAPFDYSAPVLQKYIPLHLLPKKLIVHDPWNVLGIHGSRYDGCDWTEKTDVTHVYLLRLSPEAEKRLQSDADKASKERTDVLEKPSPNHTLVDSRLSPPGETAYQVEPFVSVVLPPTPEPQPVEEAHLYLSPAHLAGRGNHSVVYYAEWEVPKSMLIPPSLCLECVREDVAAILKDQEGEDRSRMDPKWKEKSAVLNDKSVQEPVVHKSHTSGPQSNEDSNVIPEYFTAEHEGLVRPIATRVPWRSADDPYSTACSHTYPQHAYPPTTKVRVIAKLSLGDDEHLDTEATNYQKFPIHFFKHWNGSNVVAPLDDPTSAGAVVPQFYGFYVPEQKHERYLSPIMLIEDCGVPVNPKELDINDR